MALIGTQTRPRRNRPLEEVLSEQQASRPLARLGRFKIRGLGLYIIFATAALSLLALANTFQDNLVCKDVHIRLEGDESRQFLGVQDVKDLLGVDGETPLIGEKMNSIELIELEETLRANPFIRQAEVYKSVQGVLYVEVAQREPMARIVNPYGGSLYIDQDGYKFPVTRRYVPNLPLVRGGFTELQSPADSLSCEVEEALPVLRYIYQDPFWRAQISEVRLKENGDIILYPEVGDMYMEFGDASRIDEKFNQLRLFLRQLVDEIGWTRYKGVSVKYRNQVIAKRR